MRSVPLALFLLLPLACGDDKDPAATKTGTDASDTGAEGSSGPDSGATAVTGVTDGSQGTEEPGTSANSVTTPPGTDATGVTTAATEETSSASMTTAPADPDEGATQLCVDTINMYRATLGLPPLARWTDAEDCADSQCVSDGNSGVAHGAFGMCGEFAQNECPGWPGPPESMITDCLAQMWAEGPGDDFPTHGHYINMSNPSYTQVTCGFAEVNGEIWAVQDFK